MLHAVQVLFIAVGAALIGLSLWLRRMNALAQSWPVASGLISSSGIGSDTYDGERSVQISYRFEVGEREFSSTCISFAPMRADLQSQQALVARFPVGRAVDVYFDPMNPGRSVLIAEGSQSWRWFAVVGAVFIVLAVLFA